MVRCALRGGWSALQSNSKATAGALSTRRSPTACIRSLSCRSFTEPKPRQRAAAGGTRTTSSSCFGSTCECWRSIGSNEEWPGEVPVGTFAGNGRGTGARRRYSARRRCMSTSSSDCTSCTKSVARAGITLASGCARYSYKCNSDSDVSSKRIHI